MLLKMLSRRWFWEVAAELFLLEFLIAFVDSYEQAQEDARRRIHGSGNREHKRGEQPKY